MEIMVGFFYRCLLFGCVRSSLGFPLHFLNSLFPLIFLPPLLSRTRLIFLSPFPLSLPPYLQKRINTYSSGSLLVLQNSATPPLRSFLSLAIFFGQADSCLLVP